MGTMTAEELALDDDAFDASLEQLRMAVLLRRPDARTRIAAAIAREAKDAEQFRRLATPRTICRAEQCEERARRLAEILATTEKALAVPDLSGPTPETASKPARIDPIVMLLNHKNPDFRINHSQERAARTIANIVEEACRAVMPRAKNPMSLSMGRPQGGMTWRDDTPASIAWKHAHWYRPWSVAMHAAPNQNLPLCLDILVWGKSIFTAAGEHRMKWATAVLTLHRGLDLFIDLQDAQPYDPEEVARQ